METPTPENDNAANNADNSETAASKQLLNRLNIGAIHHIWHDLTPRLVSSLIMLAIFLFSVTMGGAVFSGVVLVVAMLMIREWDFLAANKPAKWGWYGIAYITAASMSVIWLRNISTPLHPHAGMGLVIYLAAIVVATDICAYFIGKQFGRNKLAPDISPKKTWEGLIGGVAGAGVAGFLCASFTPFPETTMKTVIFAMLLAFVAQGGDLFESKLKREAGVKDSGELIKGHGGVLDRLDGILTAAPVFALIVAFAGIE